MVRGDSSGCHGELTAVQSERERDVPVIRLGEVKGKGETKAQIDIVTQTPLPPPACDMATDPLPTLPLPTMPIPVPKTYADAAVQASMSATTLGKRVNGKASEVVQVRQQLRIPKQQRGRHTTTGSSTLENPSPPQARTLVMHAAPLNFKPGTMRWWWIEEGNEGMKILGMQWLRKED